MAGLICVGMVAFIVGGVCFVVFIHHLQKGGSRGPGPEILSDRTDRRPELTWEEFMSRGIFFPDWTTMSTRSLRQQLTSRCVGDLCRAQPTDWETVQATLEEEYRAKGWAKPTIVKKHSPRAVVQEVCKMGVTSREASWATLLSKDLHRPFTISLLESYARLIEAVERRIRPGRFIFGRWRSDWRHVLYVPVLKAGNDLGYYGESVADLPEQLLDVLAQETSWGYIAGDIAILAANPTAVYTERAERPESTGFHADCQPAVQWSDGFSIYALHGVIVPQWLAVREPDDIPAHWLKDIKNAEVRREFVRKLGMGRCLEQLDWQPVHSRGNYELLRANLADERSPRVCLKMWNPSAETWHMEPVHPMCRTVQQALNYRRYGRRGIESETALPDWNPEVLT